MLSATTTITGATAVVVPVGTSEAMEEAVEEALEDAVGVKERTEAVVVTVAVAVHALAVAEDDPVPVKLRSGVAGAVAERAPLSLPVAVAEAVGWDDVE